jgi:hypothetical protein
LIDRFHPHSVKQHTAFVAMSRSEVDAFYEAALNAGGRDNGPSGLRSTEAGYPPGYYVAFVLDPDDNNIEPQPFHWAKDPDSIIAAVRSGHQKC